MRLPGFLQLHPQEEVVEEPTVEENPHTHEWAEKIVTYAPPRKDIANLSTAPSDVLQAALLGVTTFLYECPICHQTRRETMLGSDRMQLDDMMDRAEQYGPQYVQRNGVTFVLQRFQQPVGGLPLR